LILCDCPIEAGAEISVLINFPVSLAPVVRSRVTAHGRVVRDATISSTFQLYGHGVAFHKLSFIRP
jgi:hypothetical protein